MNYPKRHARYSKTSEALKQDCSEFITENLVCEQKAFVAERTELLDTQGKKWEAMMESRSDKEVDFMKSRERRVDEYEQQLQHLRIQDAEEYNQCKIKLETDVQVGQNYTINVKNIEIFMLT